MESHCSQRTRGYCQKLQQRKFSSDGGIFIFVLFLGRGWSSTGAQSQSGAGISALGDTQNSPAQGVSLAWGSRVNPEPGLPHGKPRHKRDEITQPQAHSGPRPESSPTLLQNGLIGVDKTNCHSCVCDELQGSPALLSASIEGRSSLAAKFLRFFFFFHLRGQFNNSSPCSDCQQKRQRYCWFL